MATDIFSLGALGNALLDRLARDLDKDKRALPRTHASEEPGTWKLTGKLVSLDVALLALHLSCARICFRSLAQETLAKERAMGEQIISAVAGFGAGKLAKELGSKVLACLQYIADLWQAEVAAYADESAIRRGSLRTMRELQANYMGAGRPMERKRTRKVWSRTKPKRRLRKENKTWHQLPPKRH